MFKTLPIATLVATTLLTAHASPGKTSAHTSLGQRTAAQMQQNYDATPARCEGNAVPAHACSGVLLRATKPGPGYHTWHHSPNTKAKDGLSFSYIRADIPTSRLAADGRSGFTLYPQLQRPRGSSYYEVLCAWPTDGDTWTRNSNGCGDNSQTPQVEQACHQKGIDTAEQWIAEFRRSGDYKQQCAFDVRYARIPGRADAFHQSLRAKQLFGKELPFQWNELILRAWDESTSARLPIQSFFHIEGMPGALQQAQTDQRDWYKTNGTFIPVIRIRLPSEGSKQARFTYHEHEQAVAR
ncbi:hypothetical protein B7H17_03355 [Pseudomonas putida]|uniref:Halovibrin HvnA n=2 Tax=Pseudomonas putida TaxID=303 RepID=A0A1X1A4Z2_PSEPU|nr:hypothetical protein B7H17_03355 [Pseudomonas putida]